MTRITKDYDERYAEFIDTAQALFFSKGYELTSVQEIINTIGVAKGTFYHYFDSKADLLEALVIRSVKQTLVELEPIVDHQSHSPLEKIELLFAYINSWKATNRDFMIDTARVMYSDENILLRDKMKTKTQESIAPLLADIIQQGMDDNLFDVEYPLAIAQLMLKMSEGISESAVGLLMQETQDDNAIEHVKTQIIVYNSSIERILGLKKGTLILIAPDILAVWFDTFKS